MNDVLILGYGNTLRGDDGAGVRAAERLREGDAAAEILTVHELQPELVDSLAGKSLVIFLDGSLNTRQLERRELHASTLSPHSHHLLPEQLLALAAMMHGVTPPKAFVFEIPIHSVDFGETLSQETEKAVQACVEAVHQLLKGRA